MMRWFIYINVTLCLQNPFGIIIKTSSWEFTVGMEFNCKNIYKIAEWKSKIIFGSEVYYFIELVLLMWWYLRESIINIAFPLGYHHLYSWEMEMWCLYSFDLMFNYVSFHWIRVFTVVSCNIISQSNSRYHGNGVN